MSKRDTMGGGRGQCVLLHDHPAESVAYCVGFVCDLEGRSGQVGCGTSQLWGKERSGLARAPLRICWDPPSAHDFDLFCSEVSHLASSRFSFVNGRQKTAGWTWFPIRKANSSIAAYGHAHYSPSRGRKDGPLAPCFVRRLRASDGG